MSFGGVEGSSETGFEPVEGDGGDLNEMGRSGRASRQFGESERDRACRVG